MGRTEADALNGKISDESPVGHALLGKAVGEKAEVLLPTGQTVEYTVLSYHPLCKLKLNGSNHGRTKEETPLQGLSESEQVQVRRQKLADLQAAGNDPFTLTKFPQDAYSADLKEEFKDLPNETDSGKTGGTGRPYDVQARHGQGKLCPSARRQGRYPALRPPRRAGRRGLRRLQEAGRGRHHRREGRGVPHQDRRAERARHRADPAGQEPAPPAREVPRPDRYRDALPSALCGPDRKPGGEGHLRQAQPAS